ncbi:MAG: DUF5916 domain-containing protein [bacterium]
MKSKIQNLILLFLLLNGINRANNAHPPVQAIKANTPITIDGLLNEDVWKRIPIDNFTQKEPEEGQVSREKTNVWVAYDENNIYIAAKLYDSMPDQIDRSLSRRDGSFDTDLFLVYLDTYNDKRNGYYFGVNPGGSLLDGTVFNDSWTDDRWDGIWESKANITEEGWAVEMRIPYSQLRFNEADELTWGINFRRTIKRTNERSYYVMVPSKESGFVSKFALLEGLKGIKPKQRFEILPYLVQKAQYIQHDSQDPYYKDNQYRTTFGADFKVSLGSNLNLDGTINPDFGQVEVDPAVLNLTAFETYYNEKRPFFLEGTTIFDFGYGGANNNWGFNFNWPSLFYSRRIGQSPRGSVDDADYVDFPTETRILGAAKLTGKIGEGVSVGALSAVTERSFAEYKLDGADHEDEVEPLSHYGVFRLQKEFNEGKQSVGMMVTSVNRDLQSSQMKEIFPDNAFTYGVDGWITLDDSSTYVISAAVLGSYKHGSTNFITKLQKAPYRYMQRPDATYMKYDTTRSALAGWYGRVVLNKQKGNFYINASLGAISPGFDYNDLGFQYWADKINMAMVLGYRWYEPDGIFRYKSVNVAHFRDYDFEGNIYRNGAMVFLSATFENYYYIDANIDYSFGTDNKSLTRGGPLTRNPKNFGIYWDLGTDTRKKLQFGVYNDYSEDVIGGKFGDIGFDVSWKPSPSLSLTIGPYFSNAKEERQWVDKFDDNTATNTYKKRYVFAELNQKEISANIRLNWTFSPTMSLQLFLQPMFVVGDYSEYKELAAPNTYKSNVYGQNGSTITYDKGNDEYTVDPDGNGPAEVLTFSNPDFNFKSLRGNLVFRWEFLPGSVFYLVWSHEQTNFDDPGEFDMKRDFKKLVTAQSDNIYLAKFAYWFDI